MTVKNGRLEAQALVVPTGGWDVEFTDVGTTLVYAITVPAGTYSPTTLLAALIAQLNASASAIVFTGSIANGEGGTGFVTIAGDAASELKWGDDDLRAVLGFSGDLPGTGTEAGPLSFTGVSGILGVWLPDCPMSGVYIAGDAGHWEGGPLQTVSPLGVVKTITMPTRVKCGPFRWSHVSVARSRQHSESGGVRSFERFIRDTMFAQVGYFTPGCQVRLYWDAGAGDYVEFWPKAPMDTATPRATGAESWGGLCDLSIEGWQA